MSVHIQEYAPADPLKPFVVQYWEGIYCGTSSSALHLKVIPSCYIDFILHFSDARCEVKVKNDWQTSSAFYVPGFWTTPFMVQFWDKVETFNIRFKPEAMYYLFGISAAEFHNSPQDLQAVLGNSFNSFCLQLQESKSINDRIKLTNEYLLKILYSTKKSFSYVQVASDLIRNQNCSISVESLSDEVCISQRQLEREFRKKLGIGPKTYMRLARLSLVQKMIQQQPALNLAELSYLTGYSDQSHFIKDFKKLTGDVPSEVIFNTMLND